MRSALRKYGKQAEKQPPRASTEKAKVAMKSGGYLRKKEDG
jgi:hypothetical protein